MNEILRIEEDRSLPDQFKPVQGEHLGKLLARISDETRRTKTQSEAFKVVSKFATPQVGSNRSSSQLVLGQVQSGKTSNMIHTIALALDNRIPIVIVLTGTKRILDSQTSRDLRRSLSEAGEAQPWMVFVDASPKDDTFRNPKSARPVLEQASDFYIGEAASNPMCVFLLKNPSTMKTFIETLAASNSKYRDLPALIIDDEADQAGPDASRTEVPSETNQAITRLRTIFPNHNYLLYTATPQANLVSDLANSVSPDWVTNLEAGDGYIGVKDLFPAHAGGGFADPLSATDVEAFESKNLDTVPQTLIEALAEFFVKASISLRPPYDLRFATMMIHSSQNKTPMDATEKWVNSQVEDWQELFESAEKHPGLGPDPDFHTTWEKFFAPAFAKAKKQMMAAGKDVFPEVETLRQNILKLFSGFTVAKLNSDTANFPDDKWNQAKAWILIGGEKLSRGFRVENLIITYMPRQAKNKSTLDTVQQRGRFFGYRSGYRELLGAWIAPKVISAFETYRDHEEDLRAVLKELEEKNLPLKSWHRLLRTNAVHEITRKSVMKLSLKGVSFSPGSVGFSQNHPFTQNGVIRTLRVYETLAAKCRLLGLSPGSEIGSGGQLNRALQCEISFDDFENFLLDYYEAIEGADSIGLDNLIGHLGQVSGQRVSDYRCTVIFHEVGNQIDLSSPWVHAVPLDARGPSGNRMFMDAPEGTPISGISRSNETGQRVKLDPTLTRANFILHVYLFSLYRKDAGERKPDDLFANAAPVIQVSMPNMALDKMFVQVN